MRDVPERDELEPAHSPATPAPRKRKKLSEGEGETVRRLRRSHEACTRCRLKKIKASYRPHSRCLSRLAGHMQAHVTDNLDVVSYSVIRVIPVVVLVR